MTLRELMTERILFAYTEEDIQYSFDTVGIDGDLYTITDEEFLEIYEDLLAD